MFKAVLDFLMGRHDRDQVASLLFDKHGKLIVETTQSAVGMLLVDVAMADEKFDRSEVAAIIACLEQHLALPQRSAADIATIAQTAVDEPERAEQLVTLLRRQLDNDQKRLIIAMALKVANADYHFSNSEARLLDRAREWLGVDDTTFTEAKAMVRDGGV